MSELEGSQPGTLESINAAIAEHRETLSTLQSGLDPHNRLSESLVSLYKKKSELKTTGQQADAQAQKDAWQEQRTEAEGKAGVEAVIANFERNDPDGAAFLRKGAEARGMHYQETVARGAEFLNRVFPNAEAVDKFVEAVGDEAAIELLLEALKRAPKNHS